MRGIRKHELTRYSLESYQLDHRSISYFTIKNKIFSTKKAEKSRDLKKISFLNIGKIAYIPELLGF